MTDTPRLDIRNLSRRFAGRTVVDGVSLSIAPGQVTCLLGPSGCGKSTTLRMIAGVDQADAGEVWMDGELVDGRGRFVAPEARRTGLMFQDFALFPHLSAGENVAYGLSGPRGDKRARAQSLLERVGLGGYDAAFPHELSGGEQQRVALARALAPKPRLMLMDEPFSGLDNRLRDGVRDTTLSLLKEEGTAVLLVTHDPEEAMRMSDSIALMRAGRIVQEGAPYNIFSAPVDREAAGFFSDINVIAAEVNGALIETAFGQFLAPGYPDGAQVEIVFRPQHVSLDFYRNGQAPAPSVERGVWALGRVERARFVGNESIVELAMQDGNVLKASVPQVFLPESGTELWTAIRRDRCFVFGRDGGRNGGRSTGPNQDLNRGATGAATGAVGAK